MRAQAVPILVLSPWLALLAWGGCQMKKRTPAAVVAAPPPLPLSGCATAAQKRNRTTVKALRPMPLNWIIRENDLDGPRDVLRAEYVGKYVGCKLAAADLVIPQDLIALPKTTTPAGHHLRRFDLTPQQGEAYNAGDTAAVFEGAGEIFRTTILAVANDGVWYALADVSEAEYQMLKNAGGQFHLLR